MRKPIVLKVQQLDGRFFVDVPDDIATKEKLVDGQLIAIKILRTPEEVSLTNASVPSLEQMLEDYDPDQFGGELMSYPLEGREVIK